MAASRFRFGAALAKARAAASYATPYAFYRKSGGSRGLGLNFSSYLSVEKGLSLPKPWRLKRLITALGLLPRSASAKELVRLYLADLLGSEELLEGLGSPPDATPSQWKLAAAAAGQALGQRQVQLSVEQYRVLSGVPAAYACHILLKQAGEGHTAAELSALTGAAPAVVQKALKALEAQKLAKAQGSRWRSPYFPFFISPPSPTPAMAPYLAALQKERGKILDRSGRLIHAAQLFARTSPSKIQDYAAHLDEALRMVGLFVDNERLEGTEIYLAEARIHRVFTGA